ncbi:MAG: NADH-quinone oxidoreductase subunit N [Gemmataceae bacterium]
MDAPILTTLQSVFRLALPEVVLVAAACIVFLGGAFHPRKATWCWVTLAAFAGAGYALFAHRPDVTSLVPSVSALWTDHLAMFTGVTAIFGGIILLLASWDELPEEWAAEYAGCLLILSAGVGLIGAANELITLFLALEMVSIPTYVLLYLPRTGRPVQESAVKYFLLSIFSSALLLFGFSYLYGISGTTNLPAIHEALSHGDAFPISPLVLVAAVLVIAGLGFRITAVPFHFYAPDVYEGAANGPAALLAFAPKVAGFVALIRLLGLAGPPAYGGSVMPNVLVSSTQLPLLLWILAAITMTVGNIVALWQDDAKRLLAYSGIAHSGYMLIGLAVAPFQLLHADVAGGALAAMLFYLLAYGAMTIGAFSVLQAVSTRDRQVSKIDDLAGLNATHPTLALVMTLFLFSLIGIPLTGGFTGKLMLFFSALSAQAESHGTLLKVLALIAAINSAIGAYYYLRIVGVMYLRTAIKPLAGRPSIYGVAALSACAALVIWLGCYPPRVFEFTRQAALPVVATAIP